MYRAVSEMGRITEFVGVPELSGEVDLGEIMGPGVDRDIALTITPPLKEASPRCCGGDWGRAEWDGAKGACADVSRSAGVLSVKVRDEFVSGDVIFVLPGIVFGPIAFPFNEILEFPPEHAAVEDSFDLVVLFSVYQLRWWRRSGFPAWDRIWRSRSEFDHVEHGVEPFERHRQAESVSI